VKKATFVNFWVGKGTCGPKVHFMHGALVNYVLILRNVSWTEKFPCSFTPCMSQRLLIWWLAETSSTSALKRATIIELSWEKSQLLLNHKLATRSWSGLYYPTAHLILFLYSRYLARAITSRIFLFFRKSHHRSSKLHTHVIKTPNSLRFMESPHHNEEKVNQSRYNIKKKML
jgi:hypothetical protein